MQESKRIRLAETHLHMKYNTVAVAAGEQERRLRRSGGWQQQQPQ